MTTLTIREFWFETRQTDTYVMAQDQVRYNVAEKFAELLAKWQTSGYQFAVYGNSFTVMSGDVRRSYELN